MDVQALLRRFRENPERVKNAEYFRELLDSSEAKDSDHLREFVEGLLARCTQAHRSVSRMTEITSRNVGKIAERIVANEFEARGFRVSDLNKEGTAANADLVAIRSDQTLQIQVKGTANAPDGPWWVGYGYCTEEILARKGRMFNRHSSFYTANVVVLVAVRSPREYSCIILPFEKAEQVAQMHLDTSFRTLKRDGQPRKPGKTTIELEPNPRARTSNALWAEERKFLAPYRDEKGWALLLQSN